MFLSAIWTSQFIRMQETVASEPRPEETWQLDISGAGIPQDQCEHWHKTVRHTPNPPASSLFQHPQGGENQDTIPACLYYSNIKAPSKKKAKTKLQSQAWRHTPMILAGQAKGSRRRMFTTSLACKWELLQNRTKIAETRTNGADGRTFFYQFQNLQYKLPMPSWVWDAHYFNNGGWILFHSWYVSWNGGTHGLTVRHSWIY